MFDGIKSGAKVFLNNQLVLQSSNQFIRHTIEVTEQNSGGLLRLLFPPSNSSLNDDARWMACSGAWDWAPYSSTANSLGAPTFSKGLWKTAYLVSVPALAAAIASVGTEIFYLGPPPSAPLSSDTAGPFAVSVSVELLLSPGAQGAVRAWGS